MEIVSIYLFLFYHHQIVTHEEDPGKFCGQNISWKFLYLVKTELIILRFRIDEGINSTRNFSISLLQIHPLIG